MPKPNSKDDLEKANDAKNNFSSLLSDLSESQQTDFRFYKEVNQPDRVILDICNLSINLFADGTYTVE